MTLLIACILIYHYDMDWYWYGIAAVTWAGHLVLNPVVLASID